VELFGDVAQQYREFSQHAAGESPCFENWAREVADDPELLAWLGRLPRLKQQPNLVFAAARWHGVPAPGRYAALRESLLGDDGAIQGTIEARSTQTNEVGRLATLVPVLARIEAEEGRPLALLEAGSSAGLCLYPDAYRYRWHSDRGELTAGSGPELTCRVSGTAPLPGRSPRIAWRHGIDLNPLDVGDVEAMAWLETLVWPEQEERRRRLVTAIDVARSLGPPQLERGDLVEELPRMVEQAGAHGPVVVFHSAAVAYLAAPARARFVELMRSLVAAGDCRWVSNEAPQVLPAIADATPPMPTGRPWFLLGLDGRPVAWAHGHGAGLAWLT
jgi:hypothetical protein